jgi:ABC-type branched-subunit amino acid transport system substrate-binding protein
MTEANSSPDTPNVVEQSSQAKRLEHAGGGRVTKVLEAAKRWMKRIAIRDLIVTVVLALLAAYIVAPLFESAKPYMVYVVADHDTDHYTLTNTFQRKDGTLLGSLADVNVQVKLEVLDNDEEGTAEQKANELRGRPDTLMVIEHGRSAHVEGSAPIYFGVRPQIPVITTTASDDSLLGRCKDDCYNVSLSARVTEADKTQFVPLLQLSPTNRVEGHSAVQFAIQKKKKNFLVMYGSDPQNRSYANSMVAAYSAAIAEFKGQLVGTRKMDALLTASDLNSLKPDCILYAGGLGEARTLFNRLLAMHLKGQDLMVILSDSVVESRGRDSNLTVFNSPSTPGAVTNPLQVQFTHQTDAADYNSHTNSYAEDAFVVAHQLIDDLDKQGGDLRYRVKSWFHLHNVKDARRNLVRALEQNATIRTWYPGGGGMPYVFEGHKRYGGMFHVWKLQPNAEMEDIDNWHPPRAMDTVTQTGTAKVQLPQ